MISRRTFIKGAAGASVAAIAVPEILSAIGKHAATPPTKPLAIVPQPLRIPPVITGWRFEYGTPVVFRSIRMRCRIY